MMNDRTITTPSSNPTVLSTPGESSSTVTDQTSGTPIRLQTENNFQDSDEVYKPPSKFMAFLKNISLFKWGAVIIILAFLGFNIFNALGNATSGVTDILKPIASLFGYTVGETVKMSAKGTKDIVDVAAEVVDSGVNVLEKGLTGDKQRNAIDKNKKTTMKALNDAKTRPKSNSPPVADDAGSRTQLSKGSGKSGYCYIGEDRGFRSCIKVNEDDKCMSGQIFPTKDICISPNLRN